MQTTTISHRIYDITIWVVVWGIAILGMAYIGGILAVVETPGLVQQYLLPNPVGLSWFLLVTLPLTPALGNAFIALFAGIFNRSAPARILVNQVRNLVILGGAVELADIFRRVIASLTQRVFINLLVLGVSTNVITILEGTQIRVPILAPVPKRVSTIVLWGLLPIMGAGIVLNIVSIWVGNTYPEGLNVCLWAMLPSAYNVLTQFLVGMVRARRSVQAMKLVQRLYQQNADVDAIRVEVAFLSKMQQVFALRTIEWCEETGNWDVPVARTSQYGVAHMLANMGFPIISSFVSGAVSGWALTLYSNSANYRSLPIEVAKQLATNIVLRATSYPISGVGVLLSVGLAAWLLRSSWTKRISEKGRAVVTAARRRFDLALREAAVALREAVVANIETTQYQRNLALDQREKVLKMREEALKTREAMVTSQENVVSNIGATLEQRNLALDQREEALKAALQAALNEFLKE